MKPAHYLLLLAILLATAGCVPLIGFAPSLLAGAGTVLLFSVIGDFEDDEEVNDG